MHEYRGYMKRIPLIAFLALILLGCTYQWVQEPYPEILEAEKQQVDKCRMLGMVSESADAANPFSLAAEHNMILRVRERAGQLGATHIVWLHRTSTMASAEAYRCP